MKAAFYKGEGNTYNKLIRWWDGGDYSHCELVFSDGLSASASYKDGKQVRSKYIEYDPEHWDFIELPDHLEPAARTFLKETEGAPYDLFGQIRFLFAPVRGDDKGFWCSKWVPSALGLKDPWRYGPDGLYAALRAWQTLNG